jgi:FHA domain
MAEPNQIESKLNGTLIASEMIRNMELGRFEMAYTILLPCVFTIYLNPEDSVALNGVFPLIAEDAKRALRSRLAALNSRPNVLGLKRTKPQKEYKIAGRDWAIEFLPDSEVPRGDIEIHSELSEAVHPGYRGTKTTLLGREPSAGGRTTSQRAAVRPSRDPVYAEIRYQDDSGQQVYLMMQNELRIGRGGSGQPMDLALYTTDEVSREHLIIRREPGTGVFSVTDLSTNGSWVDGKRLTRGVEQLLTNRATIGVGEVLTLSFEART